MGRKGSITGGGPDFKRRRDGGVENELMDDGLRRASEVSWSLPRGCEGLTMVCVKREVKGEMKWG